MVYIATPLQLRPTDRDNAFALLKPTRYGYTIARSALRHPVQFSAAERPGCNWPLCITWFLPFVVVVVAAIGSKLNFFHFSEAGFNLYTLYMLVLLHELNIAAAWLLLLPWQPNFPALFQLAGWVGCTPTSETPGQETDLIKKCAIRGGSPRRLRAAEAGGVQRGATETSRGWRRGQNCIHFCDFVSFCCVVYFQALRWCWCSCGGRRCIAGRAGSWLAGK